jgi:hypothetical protein
MEEMIYAAAFVALLAVAVSASIAAVRRDGPDVGNLIKQLIIWASISALLPLSALAGATLLHPRTTLKELTHQRERSKEETYDTKDPAARSRFRDAQEQLTKRMDEEQRLYNRAMFRVAFPIGLIALVAGLMIRNISVGTGLAFGGACTLTTGCYTYWDDMGDALRFGSLLLVLGILIALGLFKFRRPAEGALQRRF